MEALQTEGAVLEYPIDPRRNTNWDQLTELWEYTFEKELSVNPAMHSVCITDLPEMSRVARQKMMEILFEEFNISSLYIANQAVMSMYSLGNITKTSQLT
jgi:actin-related protein